jgi:hypothetical protein
MGFKMNNAKTEPNIITAYDLSMINDLENFSEIINHLISCNRENPIIIIAPTSTTTIPSGYLLKRFGDEPGADMEQLIG